MASTEKQKQSLYFSEDTLREIMAQANRLDRSLSWTVQQAWRIAREQVRTFPTAHSRREPVHDAAPTERSPRHRAQPAADRPSEQVLEFLRGKFDHELSS